MFGSAVLDAAVGLALVYFLLATIVAQLNEFMAARLDLRAQYLKEGVHRLLRDKALADRVLGNALVSGLTGSAKRDLPSYIPPRLFALAVFDSLAAGSSPRDAKSLSKIATDKGQIALARVIDSADGDLEGARRTVGDWFSAAMDRVTGRYKRRAMWATTALGAVLTVVVGADTIAIASTLVQEQGVRAALQGVAQSASGTGLEDAFNALSGLGLPLGWTVLPATAYGWFLKILGLALTAAAVSLGAPFWFDLFKLFTNPRSSGPVPAKSDQGGQKSGA